MSKKIKIKPFYPRMTMDPEYANNTWKLLQNAILEIYKKNASGLSFEELYRNSYNMVLHKHGDKLYQGLKQTVHDRLMEVCGTVSIANDENLLAALNAAWEEHTQSMLMIRDILMYMDRVYVVHNNEAPVYDVGLQKFRENITRHLNIKDRMLNALLSNIEKERRGEVINRGLLKNITQMLVDLGIGSKTVYEDDFEKHYLSESTRFYRLEAQEFISTNSAPEYMKKVENRINEEVERVSLYLDKSTERKILDVLHQELISEHMQTLVNMPESGFIFMLTADKLPDLKRMFFLLNRVNGGHELMKSMVSELVKSTGKAIVEHPENEKKPSVFVQSLIELKDKYDKILSQAFENDKHFVLTVNQAFESFINAHPRSPEFLSLFIDEKLRKGLKGATEEEVEDTLKKVMVLFRFIQEKDVFEKYYKQHLAKRLLLGCSVSDDAEKGMISKLKTECGYQFTAKLEGMFTDMRTSNTTMESFKNYISSLDKNPLKGVDINVNVLTTGFWPTQTAATCTLPAEIQQCCQLFEKFYLNNHSGRRLTWQTNMGTGELRAHFGSKRHELNVSTFQMCILLLFNKHDSLSFKDIQEVTSIPIQDLKRNLYTLSCAKYKILIKDPQNAKFLPTDSFAFNNEFKSKLFRVKVNPVPMGNTDKERDQINEKINEDNSTNRKSKEKRTATPQILRYTPKEIVFKYSTPHHKIPNALKRIKAVHQATELNTKTNLNKGNWQ